MLYLEDWATIYARMTYEDVMRFLFPGWVWQEEE